MNDKAVYYLPTELLINNLPPGNGAGIATGPPNEATIDWAITKLRTRTILALNPLHLRQGKTWAEPLGKGLAVGAKIADGLGSFVPGANIVGGALAFGASLLNPEPTIEDLQEELQEINWSWRIRQKTEQQQEYY